ncbi:MULTISPECIES: CsxC family protein [unclassified Bacillus (in: firmicutes)]|uniref:CsxC family protein n=1 Tax=unclassified Bacillus (in: firmicutes) TaxID=185979 RepID=UPI0008EBFC87|nr:MULTISPECIES: DUF3794 domain-containing protein [unclassified Bacillus (in: firmicutes)]SFB09382.1 hypothetical protein SAMN02799634_105251 [Bacillus sp. UNCCL13]SFQ86731.1 hypothetical protein SAMN04488577_2869 [Bacillus sp. cl95]
MCENHHNDCIDFNKTAGLGECDSVEVTPVTTPAGTVTLRVPVTLAERTVTTNLSANINFPDPVLEIKDIKKRVKIVQCSLLLDPVVGTQNPFDLSPGTLILRGFVRKNIQYATPIRDSSGSCVSSNLKSLTVDVPFECVTTIPQDEFLSPPQRPQLNSRAEFDFFRSQNLGMGFPEKDHLLSSDLSQFHQSSTGFYNQFPTCEIISHNILEWDEAVDRQPLPGNAPFEEGTFQRIVEKMILRFTIKVLQNQQVRVTALP